MMTSGVPESSLPRSDAWREAEESGVDMSLLEESLSRTPWERMLANDDALNFAESLRAAMEKRNAESS